MQPDIELMELGQANSILRSCSEETRARIVEQGNVRAFQAGDVVLRKGDDAGMAFLPLSGKLQLSRTAASGRRQVFCHVTPAGCPAICLLMLSDQSVVDVIAVESGSMVTLARDELTELALIDRVFGQESWSAVSHCMTRLLGMVENLSFHKVGERVVLALLEGTNRGSNTVRCTQAELAAEVGTTREVVARCLAELQESGAIRLGRGRITVLERARLVSPN